MNVKTFLKQTLPALLRLVEGVIPNPAVNYRADDRKANREELRRK